MFGDDTFQSTAAGGGGIPSGIIVMWSGSYNDIPSGWTLCNGTSGTPDLRNSFIYGVNTSYGPGNNADINTTGGATAHYHNISRIEVRLSYSGISNSLRTGTASPNTTLRLNHYLQQYDQLSLADYGWSSAVTGYEHRHYTMASNTTPKDALPPFYKLAFICKL